jgi:hypothetical protein
VDRTLLTDYLPENETVLACPALLITKKLSMAADNENAAIQQVAQRHAEEILARRAAARATRKAAFEGHREPISIKTELTRFQFTAACATEAAPQVVSARTQTAGCLLAVADSWFDYPIEDVLTKLDDNYGYNIESAARISLKGNRLRGGPSL